MLRPRTGWMRNGLVIHKVKVQLPGNKNSRGAPGSFNIRCNSGYSADTGSTETYERSSRFFWNFTTPSTSANRVWSLPMPTFSPGL